MFRDLKPAAIMLLLAVSQPSMAEPLRLAVAANFKSTLTTLVSRYKTDREDLNIDIIPGSTGALTAQIIQGAPFHVLFAADSLRPEELENRGLTRHRQTYAIGQLVLWVRAGAEKGKVGEAGLVSFTDSIAIANPRHAPYGLAATQVLEKLNPELFINHGSVVYGNNVAQAFTFVKTGNANAGMVSLSQVLELGVDSDHYWKIPGRYHDDIEQQLVIMENAPDAAARFVSWLNEVEARDIIRHAGYRVEVNLHD